MDPDTFNFKLHLQGRALSNHSVNAREFGVSLIGLNDTLSVIAKQMGGTQQTSALRVHSQIRPGSVSAVLDYIIAAVGGVPSLFTDSFSAAKTALECLVLLMQLRQKHQDTEVTRQDVDTIAHQTVYNNCVFNNFSDNACNLAMNIHNSGAAAKAMKNMFSPLAEGNQTEQYELQDIQGNTILKTDRNGYAKMFKEQHTETIKYPLMEHIFATLVGIRFDDKNWTVNAEGNVYNAKMKDPNFLSQVKNTEVAFTDGTTVEIDLQPIATVKNNKTSMSYEITKVHAINPKTPGELF